MVVISNSALFVCQSRPKAQYAIAGEISSPQSLLTVLQRSLKIQNCLSILYLFYIGIAWVLILAQVKSVIWISSCCLSQRQFFRDHTKQITLNLALISILNVFMSIGK